jgi:hypothetical protein
MNDETAFGQATEASGVPGPAALGVGDFGPLRGQSGCRAVGKFYITIDERNYTIRNSIVYTLGMSFAQRF